MFMIRKRDKPYSGMPNRSAIFSSFSFARGSEKFVVVRPHDKKTTGTSGYATWFTAGGAIRIAHYDVIDDVISRKL